MDNFELRGLQWLTMDITHRCNLNCNWCGKRTHESNYEMTWKQLKKMVEVFSPYYNTLRISGGEPLVHPEYDNMVKYLKNSGFCKIAVATNGILLSSLPPDIFDCADYVLSYYPGVNDKAYEKFKDSPKVKAITNLRFLDPYYDPDLSDEGAMETYLGCPYIQIKVIGSKVYGCCHAETISRLHNIRIGARIDEKWKGKLLKSKRWKACKHCFVARPRIYMHPRDKQGLRNDDINSQNG